MENMNIWWELDVSKDEGKTWETVKMGPSCDSCKSYAREYFHKRSDGSGINTNFQYRIYTLGGQQLYCMSSNNQSWRMKWEWGNLKSRELQLHHEDIT